jgi:hypothetical protein
MRRLLLAVAFLIASCGIASADEVSPAVIVCPLADAPTVGLPNLPGGWWTNSGGTNSFLKLAASVGLTEARVVAADGAHILECRYGSVGALMRIAPANGHCAATSVGFQCSGAG